MTRKARFGSLTILTVLIGALLAACGGSPATTAPTAATDGGVAATAAPASGDTSATVAPEATATPETASTEPTLAPTVVSSGEGCAPGAPKVTWYVGLGAGSDADVIPKQTAWVDKFNKSQTDACLILQVVHNPESYDTLKAQIAAGTTPDIVGPTGRTGRASFQGAWQDITPLA
ncbi:MAG TPA: hypothetical protein VFS21_33800, partial [Roseiflexaceae bacterium]|nr:hypothetical protein [Roseiflexaceae bacterium]